VTVRLADGTTARAGAVPSGAATKELRALVKHLEGVSDDAFLAWRSRTRFQCVIPVRGGHAIRLT
jgi:hypothetical protein